MRGIKKSSKTGSKSSKRQNTAGSSIEDIIGILGKRKSDTAPEVEKENLHTSQNDRTLSQVDVLSATDTLTSDDVGVVEQEAQPNNTITAVDEHTVSKIIRFPREMIILYYV